MVHESVEPNELWHIRLAHVHYRALPLARKYVEGIPKIQAKHEGVYKVCVGLRIYNIFLLVLEDIVYFSEVFC